MSLAKICYVGQCVVTRVTLGGHFMCKGALEGFNWSNIMEIYTVQRGKCIPTSLDHLFGCGHFSAQRYAALLGVSCRPVVRGYHRGVLSEDCYDLLIEGYLMFNDSDEEINKPLPTHLVSVHLVNI